MHLRVEVLELLELADRVEGLHEEGVLRLRQHALGLAQVGGAVRVEAGEVGRDREGELVLGVLVGELLVDGLGLGAERLDVGHGAGADLAGDAGLAESRRGDHLLHDGAVPLEVGGEGGVVRDGLNEFDLVGLGVVLAPVVVVHPDDLRLGGIHLLHVRVPGRRLGGLGRVVLALLLRDVEVARADQPEAAREHQRHVGVLVSLRGDLLDPRVPEGDGRGPAHHGEAPLL